MKKDLKKNSSNVNIEDVISSLKERVKELECLYRISQISVEKINWNVKDILYAILKVIPKAWQYPEVTNVKINLDGIDYYSNNFKEPWYSQQCNLVIDKKKRGYVEVSYSKEVPFYDEGPFLKEERNLIDTIAVEISIIIERIEQKNEKNILEQRLKHADRLSTIGELTAGIAHELNEPLGSILGFTQLIQKENTNKSIAVDLNKIIEASLHARNVIRKLIAFSKYDDKQNFEKININLIIADGLYFLDNRCKKENIQIVKILDDKIPDTYINKTQMHQIIVNLCVNAIQAMPDGGELVIQTKFVNCLINIIVQDTGIGISEENIAKVFDPFFTTKENSGNTGLGLSVVYGIIESFKGSIEVESTINSGTRFKIILPVEQKGE